MIDILLGAVVFFLAQYWKKIDTQYGTAASKNLLLVLAFLVSVLLATGQFLYSGQAEISIKTLIENGAQIWSLAILIYQIIYKRIVLPILEFTKNKI